MRTITILDEEIRELLLEHKTLTFNYADNSYEGISRLTVSALPGADPAADVVVSPHDIWDAEVGGSVVVEDRAGEKVLIRASNKGMEDPLAISREDRGKCAYDLSGYG